MYNNFGRLGCIGTRVLPFTHSVITTYQSHQTSKKGLSEKLRKVP